MIAKGVLPFQYVAEERERGMTAQAGLAGLAGLALYLDLFKVIGLRLSIKRHVGVRGSQGRTDAQVITALVLPYWTTYSYSSTTTTGMHPDARSEGTGAFPPGTCNAWRSAFYVVGILPICGAGGACSLARLGAATRLRPPSWCFSRDPRLRPG